MKSIPQLKKYLFRERLLRAILKEWRERREISLRAICNKYDLPYFRSRNFLMRLTRDRIIIWRKEPDLKRIPYDFWLTPSAVKRLQQELLYASSV